MKLTQRWSLQWVDRPVFLKRVLFLPPFFPFFFFRDATDRINGRRRRETIAEPAVFPFYLQVDSSRRAYVRCMIFIVIHGNTTVALKDSPRTLSRSFRL